MKLSPVDHSPIPEYPEYRSPLGATIRRAVATLSAATVLTFGAIGVAEEARTAGVPVRPDPVEVRPSGGAPLPRPPTPVVKPPPPPNYQAPPVSPQPVNKPPQVRLPGRIAPVRPPHP